MTVPFAYLAHRGVLSLSGPDTLAMLERLVTNNTHDWATGEARPGALLTPQGKVIADYLALRTEDGILLDVAREVLPDLEKRLKLFRLRADVTIEPRGDLIVLAGVEPASHGVRPVSGAAHVFIDPRFSGGRLRVLATEADWSAWHGGHPAEWSRPWPEYALDRIRQGVAEFGTDFGAAEVFPSDINLDRMGGVDLRKGCFVGQEVVSRMHRRGNVRRRTVVLEAANATPGAKVRAGGPLGEITSAEDGLALARLRIDRLARGQAGGHPVTVDDRPATLHVPDWLAEEAARMTDTPT